MSVVFWDFDGTLADSVSLWARSGYEALRLTDENALMDFMEFKRLLLYGEGCRFPWRTPDSDHTRHAGENFWTWMNGWYAECYMRFGVGYQTAAAAAEKVAGILTRAENYTLYPDAAKTLAAVREMGHINSMISNNYPELPRVLEELGILGYIESPVVSGREGYDKPRRELFETAKARFPGETYIMVGDNPAADMLGARNAGMTAILVHAPASENADYCFDDLWSVAELLREKDYPAK